jgi:hypothetical protein
MYCDCPTSTSLESYVATGAWASLETPYSLRVDMEARPIAPDDASLLDDLEPDAGPRPEEPGPNATRC